MVRQYEQPTQQFAEWASNISDGVFAMLKLYADESGVHDDAEVTVLGGVMDKREYWEEFCREWGAVLNNYKVRHFHFREFRQSANTKPTDTYYAWPLSKRRDFLYSLSMVLGHSAVPAGGAYATKRNAKLGIPKDPFEETIRSFYESVLAMLNLYWPDERVHVVFDDSKNRKWTGVIHEIHHEFKTKDKRICTLAFDDDETCMPLQGADFTSMLFRNTVKQYVDVEGQSSGDARIIDFIVHKNQDPRFRRPDKKKFKKMIDDMRDDEATKTASWRSQGIKRTYIPLQDFDFEEFAKRQRK
jgi:hypothetical protein